MESCRKPCPLPLDVFLSSLSSVDSEEEEAEEKLEEVEEEKAAKRRRVEHDERPNKKVVKLFGHTLQVTQQNNKDQRKRGKWTKDDSLYVNMEITNMKDLKKAVGIILLQLFATKQQKEKNFLISRIGVLLLLN